jgi:hypothetical protein
MAALRFTPVGGILCALVLFLAAFLRYGSKGEGPAFRQCLFCFIVNSIGPLKRSEILDDEDVKSGIQKIGVVFG